MKWIVSLITLGFLVVFIIVAFNRQSTKERTPALMLLFALLIYHIGDMGLWAGWDYEIVRRIASVGFYFIMPFSLWLMYVLVPKEKMNLFIRIVTLLLIIPWIYAIVMIKGSPLVFLEEQMPVMEEAYESFIMMLVLFFVVGTIFTAIVGFIAARKRDDYGKGLALKFSWGIIIYTVLILCFFMSIDLFGIDLTWLFGIATVIYSLLIILGLKCHRFDEKTGEPAS